MRLNSQENIMSHISSVIASTAEPTVLSQRTISRLRSSLWRRRSNQTFMSPRFPVGVISPLILYNELLRPPCGWYLASRSSKHVFFKLVKRPKYRASGQVQILRNSTYGGIAFAVFVSSSAQIAVNGHSLVRQS